MSHGDDSQCVGPVSAGNAISAPTAALRYARTGVKVRPPEPRGCAGMSKQALQVVEPQRIRTVGQGPVGVRVHLEKKGIAARGDRRPSQRWDHLALARRGRAAGPAPGS